MPDENPPWEEDFVDIPHEHEEGLLGALQPDFAQPQEDIHIPPPQLIIGGGEAVQVNKMDDEAAVRAVIISQYEKRRVAHDAEEKKLREERRVKRLMKAAEECKVQRSPTDIPQHILLERASKIPVSPDKRIRSDLHCMRCRHYFEDHNKIVGGRCYNCTSCPGFITTEQVSRVNFTGFLTWCRKWLSVSGRKIERLKNIWDHYREIGHLAYCHSCATPVFTHNTRGVVKNQDGLACGKCNKCHACCKCKECQRCHKKCQPSDTCPTCTYCYNNNCCKCRECEVCGAQCGYDYCIKCLVCNTCCKCNDAYIVPLRSPQQQTFHRPTLKQHTINPVSRFVAVEIEVAGIKGSGRPIYELVKSYGGGTVRDGSLSMGGFEINTAPAGGDLFAEQVLDICKEIANQRGFIDHKCGLHVHVDARDLTYYDMRRLIRVYAVLEPLFFAMVPLDRQRSRYCHPCGERYVRAIEEGRLPYDKVKSDVITTIYGEPSTENNRSKYNQARYNALNLHSWFYRGTIESRMFDGCIDPDTIIHWGMCWGYFVDYIVRTTDEEASRDASGKAFALMRKIIGDNKDLVKFIKDRIARYGGSTWKGIVCQDNI